MLDEEEPPALGLVGATGALGADGELGAGREGGGMGFGSGCWARSVGEKKSAAAIVEKARESFPNFFVT